jgi:HPt (histidine-containing phosphotransfer) domain-containing protein
MAELMDKEDFAAFVELFGDEAPAVLQKYCDVAKGYVKTIRDALATEDYKKMAAAAHPLKSSSRQVGARGVSMIAAEMEKMGSKTVFNPNKLNQLLAQLEAAQTRVAEAIAREYPVKK